MIALGRFSQVVNRHHEELLKKTAEERLWFGKESMAQEIFPSSLRSTVVVYFFASVHTPQSTKVLVGNATQWNDAANHNTGQNTQDESIRSNSNKGQETPKSNDIH